MQLSFKSLKAQLVVLMLASSIVIVGGISIVLSMSFNQLREYNVNELTMVLRSNYDNLIKSQTQQAATTLQTIWATRTNDQAAIEACRNVLRQMRYLDDKSGYFWADTYDGLNMVHAIKFKTLEGTNRMDAKDSSGKLLIREIIANGQKAGGGFTDYSFTKTADDPKEYPKRGYSIAVPELGWVIGTGNYVDDIDAAITGYTTQLNNNFVSAYQSFLAISIGILFVSSCVIFLFNMRIFSGVMKLTSALRNLTKIDADLHHALDEDGPAELAAGFKDYNIFVAGIREIFMTFIQDGKKIEESSLKLLARLQDVEQQNNGIITRTGAFAKQAAEAKTLNREALVTEIKTLQKTATNMSMNLSNIIDDAKKRNDQLHDTLSEVSRFKLESRSMGPASTPR